MSYWTVTQQAKLVTGTNPAEVLGSIAEGGMIVNSGDLVTVADPPVTLGSYTQVTTSNGTVGWVSTSALSQGVAGSSAMNLGIIAAIAVGAYFLLFRR